MQQTDGPQRQPSPRQPISAKYMTYVQASEAFGISRMTLYRLMVKGVIACYKPGKKVLFSIRDLECYFLSTKIKPKKKRVQQRRRVKMR